jgi:hypothetical protein
MAEKTSKNYHIWYREGTMTTKYKIEKLKCGFNGLDGELF